MADSKTQLLRGHEPDAYQRASAWILEGHPVALPTETVYGLAADAANPNAIAKVFQAKERPHFDPLIVHLPDSLLESERSWVEILENEGWIDLRRSSTACREALLKLSHAFWPGPLTLVLPKGKAVNELITGGLDTVGLRIPQHPQFQQVLKESQTYLCAPSANRFKSISPTRSSDVIDELDGRIPAVLDGGPCAIGVESTVLSLSPTGEATILRYGQVSKEDLEGVINTEVKNLDSLHDASAPQTISAPGQMKTHYAPSKPFYYLDQNLTPARWSHVLDVLGSERHHGCSLGLLLTQQTNVTFNNTYPDLAACFEHIVTLCDDIPEGNNIKTEYHEALSRKSLEPDDATAAHRLFPALRALDQGPAEVLLTEPFPQRSGIAHAIHDRLMKATSHQVIHA